MRFHRQNLNQDKRGFWGREHRFPWHGRAWLRALGRTFRACWDLWGHLCGLGLTFNGDEQTVTIFVAFPPVSLWFTMSARLWQSLGYASREIEVRVHSGALWWSIWRDEMAGWDSSVPRWRQGAWHPLDTLLGRAAYSKVEMGTHAVLIPMPEGCYPATATFERCTWKRPRWFARVRDFTRVDVGARAGIPHEGKGESSWDCGIDGLCGYSTEGHDLDAAIGDGVARSLRYRQQRDGSRWAKYPTPAAAAAEGTAP
jgi:hypothetical protein